MTPSDRAPVVIVGIGNSMRGDDGIGAALVDALSSSGPAGDVDLLVLDGEATRLLEAWRDRRLAVVVDAVVAGSPPGSIHRVEAIREGRERADLPRWRAGASSHAVGLAEAVELGTVVDRLPLNLVVLGVEPGELGPGPGLSPAVAAALPALLGAIGELLADPR